MRLHDRFPSPPVAELTDQEVVALNYHENGKPYNSHIEDLGGIDLRKCHANLMQERADLLAKASKPGGVLSFFGDLIAADITLVEEMARVLAGHGILSQLDNPDASH